MENVTKFFIFSVSLSITAILASLIFYVYKTGDTTYKMFGAKVLEIFSTRNEPEFTSWVGRNVDGKSVRATLEEYGGGYFFRIKTKRNPVSFCVVNRPVNNRIAVDFEGKGEYADYSSSGSIYYINSNAQFTTRVIRDDYGTIVGAQFEEKGVSVLTAGVKKKYLPGEENPTLDQVKEAYTSKLNSASSSLSTAGLQNTLASLKQSKKDTDKEIDDLDQKFIGIGGAGSNAQEELKSALAESTTAMSNAENAWEALTKKFKEQTGNDAMGHYEITEFSPVSNLEDDRNLQYWINKYNKKEAGNE